MSMNPHLSEEELSALLASPQDEPCAGADRLPAQPAALQQETELLHALRNAVKTLTVRVASLESEVGRLRAGLSVVRGEQLPPAEKRIVIEGITLPELPAELEVSAAADTQVELGSAAAGFATLPRGGSGSIGAETIPPPAGAQNKQDAAVAAALLPRAARHRKPEKKSFFTRLFHK